MTAETVIVLCGGNSELVKSVDRSLENRDNVISPCNAYQLLLSDSNADIIAYIHDDVDIHQFSWQTRVLGMFENPNCVVVGLGGATSLGRPDLYRRPYRIENMARAGYCSNQTDAEVHGERFTGSKRVAVVDAFFLAIRREWLAGIGGWPLKYLTHHCLDLWIGCEAARAGKEVWMTGVSCTHHGGGTSTKAAYKDASWLQGGTRDSDHAIPHKWLYENYRDALPINL